MAGLGDPLCGGSYGYFLAYTCNKLKAKKVDIYLTRLVQWYNFGILILNPVFILKETMEY